MSREIVNFESAMERLGDDKEFLIELLTELVDQVDQTIPDIEQAVSLSDFVAIDSLAHGLKGAAANLNVDPMAEIFKELEHMGKEKDLSGGDDKIEQIKQANIDLKEWLKNN